MSKKCRKQSKGIEIFYKITERREHHAARSDPHFAQSGKFKSTSVGAKNWDEPTGTGKI